MHEVYAVLWDLACKQYIIILVIKDDVYVYIAVCNLQCFSVFFTILFGITKLFDSQIAETVKWIDSYTNF